MASGAQGDIEDQLQANRTQAAEWLYRLKDEQSFVVSEELSNASAGDTTNIYLENPANSGTTAVFIKPVGNAASVSWARTYDGFDGDPSGSGTPIDVQNNLLDSGGENATDPGVVAAEKDVTFTPTNGPYYSMVIGGGVGSGSHSGKGPLAGVAIEPGRRVVVEVEKVGSGLNPVAINAEFYEVPVVFSEENIDPEPLTVFPT